MFAATGKKLLGALIKFDRASKFSSVPEKVVETGFGEFVRVSPSVPLLVRLHERGWGALASLPASKLDDAGYKDNSKPKHIAVVRDAFAAHDENPRSLAEAIHPIGPNLVAIASDITHPHERLVVDQYEINTKDDHYHLTSIGTDLLRFLKNHEIHMRHVPDVRSAAAAIRNHRTANSTGIPLKQSTNQVLMVAPTAFVFNAQAAQDNSFMNTTTGTPLAANATQQVLKEFASLYDVLTERAGVKVNLFQHSLDHGTPDAVFPNNWFSTHSATEAQGGVGASTLVYYPMKCPNRQAERREDIMAVLNRMGYERIVDMTGEESNDRYFEGTGVLVIDRINGVAYVAMSERAHHDIARDWVDKLGYKDLVTFRSSDENDSTVYHTNVMMAIGTSVAVACLESIGDDKERKNFVSKLSKTHEIVDISRRQMADLCGNVLELEDGRGLPIMAMSTRAYNAFTEDQRKVMRKHVAELHHASIDTLEHIGGGGVRCTLAEIFP